MTDRELMQQVMENICGAKLCEINSMSSRQEMLRLLDKAIDALGERLTKPERQWVGLTDEEITELSDFVYAGDPQYLRLIETKLREKNT
jgi:hypothetical protein